MAEISTKLTLTLTLDGEHPPTLGTGYDLSTAINPPVSMSFSAIGTPTSPTALQPSLPGETPTLQIYNNRDGTKNNRPTTNEIVWKLVPSDGGTWGSALLTCILGIVVEKGGGSASENPGGGSLRNPSVLHKYINSPWAGEGGLGAEEAYLYLAQPGSVWSLLVNTSKFYTNKTSAPSVVKKRTGKKKKDPWPLAYRVYFFSETIGVWWIDPTLDILPEVTVGDDPDSVRP